MASFPGRVGVSYIIRKTSDGDSNGSIFEWYGWNTSTGKWVWDTYPWVNAVSAWVEWRQVETSLGVWNWGDHTSTDPTISLLHGLFQQAITRNKYVLLRVPAGHWVPSFILGSTEGLVPDCGVTVGGLGVTAYRMPVVIHPNYRTHLTRFRDAIRAFLNTTYQGVTYGSRVIGMPLDAASDAGSEWPTSVINKLANITAMNTVVDTYGPIAQNYDGSAFGEYPRSDSDTYGAWKADAWAEQWRWGVESWIGNFNDLPIIVGMGQMFGDADSHELLWSDPAQLNMFGGVNKGRLMALRTNWSPSGTDNVTSTWLGYGLDQVGNVLSRSDRLTLLNARRAGGSIGFQSASTSVYPANFRGASGSTVWGIVNDLTPNWPDIKVLEMAEAQMTNGAIAAALQSFQSVMVATSLLPPEVVSDNYRAVVYTSPDSPAGVIAADPGSVCLVGDAVWLKTSGVGVSGWELP